MALFSENEVVMDADGNVIAYPDPTPTMAYTKKVAIGTAQYQIAPVHIGINSKAGRGSIQYVATINGTGKKMGSPYYYVGYNGRSSYENTGVQKKIQEILGEKIVEGKTYPINGIFTMANHLVGVSVPMLQDIDKAFLFPSTWEGGDLTIAYVKSLSPSTTEETKSPKNTPRPERIEDTTPLFERAPFVVDNVYYEGKRYEASLGGIKGAGYSNGPSNGGLALGKNGSLISSNVNVSDEQLQEMCEILGVDEVDDLEDICLYLLTVSDEEGKQTIKGVCTGLEPDDYFFIFDDARIPKSKTDYGTKYFRSKSITLTGDF